MANGGRNGDRVAVIAGLRTPFLKQGTGFRDMSALELSSTVVNELIQRTALDPKTFTLCVFGQVIPSLDYINIAREVVLRTGLDPATEAYSVSRACATSMQALTSCIEEIERGHHEAAIAGGAESMDDVPLGVSKPLTRALMALQRSKTVMDKLKLLSAVSPRDLVPPMPGYLVEPTTGLSMGQSAEKMAKENGISRQSQDTIAFRSHVRAAKAWAGGFYSDQVMPVIPPPFKEGVREDNIIRKESRLEQYSALKPVYDRAHGTITAGNASPLTDGAAALALMRESKARDLGLDIMGYVRSWAYTAVDPGWQLLMAPVWAVPIALRRAGLSIGDISLVEMHEAFAAQVASNLQAMASRRFCEEKLGLSEPIGEIDPEILNVNGGSIALGHPFGATGARIVMQGLKELKLRNKQFGLMTICAGGALGVAAVLEVAC
jgi:acetyl-CoA acyltransferase